MFSAIFEKYFELHEGDSKNYEITFQKCGIKETEIWTTTSDRSN